MPPDFPGTARASRASRASRTAQRGLCGSHREAVWQPQRSGPGRFGSTFRPEFKNQGFDVIFDSKNHHFFVENVQKSIKNSNGPHTGPSRLLPQAPAAEATGARGEPNAAPGRQTAGRAAPPGSGRDAASGRLHRRRDACDERPRTEEGRCSRGGPRRRRRWSSASSEADRGQRPRQRGFKRRVFGGTRSSRDRVHFRVASWGLRDVAAARSLRLLRRRCNTMKSVNAQGMFSLSTEGVAAAVVHVVGFPNVVSCLVRIDGCVMSVA